MRRWRCWRIRMTSDRTGFFEALYGHLMLAGNAYVEPLVLGERLRELHLLRHDKVSVVERRDAGSPPMPTAPAA